MMRTRSRRQTSFQFTPLREGRPDGHGDGRRGHISIHAPPRGATKSYVRCCDNSHISIHAPPRGATLEALQNTYISLISIHAPPRGATRVSTGFVVSQIFQFTPLREGRLPYITNGRAFSEHFNSRPSARGDFLLRICVICILISIHAPPRGATATSGGTG